jgi:hypothetical protein
VRKAHTIVQRDSVAAWLYKVAYRVALLARSRQAVLRRTQALAQDDLGPAVPDDVPAANVATVRQLIKQLDSDDFAKRTHAAQELARLGDSAAPQLRQSLTARPPPAVRRRLQELLEGVGPMSPQRLGLVRAIEVLAQAATPEARELFTKRSRGAPRTLLTGEVTASVGRMAARAAPRK